MSVDDQLFKEDGTWITKIDIVILKAARFIAAHLFADEDDETFDKALKRAFKAAAVVTAFSAMLTGISGSAFGMLIIIWIAQLYWRAANGARCNGLGTIVPQLQKLASFLFLLLGPSSMLVLSFAIDVANGQALAGNVAYSLGYFLACLARFYIERLQNKPPRLKRVRVFRLAFNPQ